VPRTGFEPAHLTALPPEDSASTNFATWAWGCKCKGLYVKYEMKNRRLSVD
jgi:hypothetical protein